MSALLSEPALATMEFTERLSRLRKERSLALIDGMILKHKAEQVIASAATSRHPASGCNQEEETHRPRAGARNDVPTRRLSEKVRRNADRFLADLMFQLTATEWAASRSQFATLKTGRGRHRKYLPYAFTEHGALMAATVLNSPRATEVAIYVVRAFVQLRDLLASNKELARQLKALEQRLERKLDTHDQAIASILNAIRQLMAPPPHRNGNLATETW